MRYEKENIKIDLNGNYKLYNPIIPDGAKALGTVKNHLGTGALIKLSNGIFVRMNAGVITSLNQYLVKKELGE